MATPYSVDDLVEFLAHATERGLLPSATAQALAVAVRNVFGILSDTERQDVRQLDVAAVVRRFTNKRAKDFTPKSLKEYGRRVHRAVDHYLRWRADPSSFATKTRTTRKASRWAGEIRSSLTGEPAADAPVPTSTDLPTGGGYRTSFPIRPGVVVTLLNIPQDLSAAEAERLGQFVGMLAIG